MKEDRLQELDALRGIAALLVVLFHYSMGRPAKFLGFELGISGVDLFFIISGFVIYMSIHKRGNLKGFLIRRFFRLYPVYWIVVSFTTVLTLFNFAQIELEPITFTKYVSNLTMFQSYLGETDIDGPYWTMIVEMLFYLLITTLILLKVFKHILYIGYALISLLLINELIIQPINPDLFNWLFQTSHNRFILLGHFPLFFAGILFYHLYFDKTSFKLVLGIAICYVTTLLIFQNVGRSHSFIELPQYIFMISLYFGVFILLVNRKLGFIVNPVTLFLGEISYPLYLIHQFLGIKFLIPYLEKEYNVYYVQGIIISILVSLLISYLITRYIEKTSIRFGRKMVKKYS
jgi:peptidoglycan/LPS O-acetylase OafA/YrhL